MSPGRQIFAPRRSDRRGATRRLPASWPSGRYGSAQVLPLLDPAEAREACKPFVGYSDLTALLTFLTMNCEMVAFHGPMLDGRLGRGHEGYDRDSFEKALCRREPMGELMPPGLATISQGEAHGMLLGGTLTQVLASIGTPYAFDAAAWYVLFLDEVGERPYGWIEWSRSCSTPVCWHERAPSSSANCRVAMNRRGRHSSGRYVRLVPRLPGQCCLVFLRSYHRSGSDAAFRVMCHVIADAQPRLIIEESAVQ
jgi:hypothetical protein